MRLPNPYELPMTADELVAHAVFVAHARYTGRVTKRLPFWSLVGDVFSTGSGYSARIAHACGYHPDSGEPLDAPFPSSPARDEKGEEK